MTVSTPVWTRLHRFVETAPSGCWLWMGSRIARGYGRVGFRGRLLLAHRAVYEELIGPVPTGLELDHVCRNRACVNPLHLEPVTHLENVQRGAGHPYKDAIACKHGHLWSPENTARDRYGRRVCRRCASLRQQAYKARKVA